MVVIRLSRKGMKNQPFYRITVADQSFPRDGRFLEVVGTYDPLGKSERVILKKDRVKFWLDRGAQPSDTVRSLLKRHLN